MTAWGGKDNPQRWKPVGFEQYKTRGEVIVLVKRDRTVLRHHERIGNIPSPIRVKVGRHSVRLYSPTEVEQIVAFFAAIDEKLAKQKRRRKKRR